ncbi:uncharacterized protein LOC134250553 [Saccostrea cucullata]|uniref:uncharacterized protein LOC134250553 n=1 Tax=Saccostrea cuccullata TaxID=36930 RepID=UPI002ED2470E
MSQDCSSGRIVGSVIGGAVFGSLVTVLVFMLHRRIQKKQIRIRVVETLQNPAYNAEIMSINDRAEEEDTGKSTYSEISDQKSMKVSHVAPIRRNANTSKTTDGVYNHLNETASDARSEYYDHAKPGASVSTSAEGYCTVTIDNGGNDEHIEDNGIVDDHDKISEKAKADEYFVLEKIQ